MTVPKPFSVAGVPAMIVPAWHTEPCPRHVRAVQGGAVVVDSTAAVYVWEWPGYPQFYVPVGDVVGLGPVGAPVTDGRGTYDVRDLGSAADAATVVTDGPLAGHVKLDWDVLDAWFEEDEEVFVHPRSPYTRVDALRSQRHVEVFRDGMLLADSWTPVLVFETGLPTRYYVPRPDVKGGLVPSGTVSSCPYKGRTSGYWSVQTEKRFHPDLAWSYDFPTAALLPIAGLICFYNERVDITLDGLPLERPRTRFS